MPKPDLLGELGGAERAGEHRFDVDVACVAWQIGARILVHHGREKVLIQRPPVHSDANWLGIVHGNLDDRAEILVAPFATDVAGVDAVLGQRRRADGILREEQVPVVVEIPDDWHRDPVLGDALGDLRHGGGGRLIVHRDAHELRAGARQRDHLRRRGRSVRRVRVGHGLHHQRRGASHLHIADPGADRPSPI